MPESQILFNHAWIAFQAAGIDSTAYPVAGNAAWIDVGEVGDLQVTRDEQTVPIMKSMPGRKRRTGVLKVSSTIDYLIPIKEGGPLLWQFLFGTNPLEAGEDVEYNTDEAASHYAWLKIQQYDTNEQLVNTIVTWNYLQIGGAVTFGEQLLEYQLKGMECYSPLNQGTLAKLV